MENKLPFYSHRLTKQKSMPNDQNDIGRCTIEAGRTFYRQFSSYSSMFDED
ncbi:hypothetical protein I79_020173 [Cricetulus griseus]|uniref:Uncharacterized protein n=1 Tax=Cricetulus griseus TaxID=10029 RepID=G3I9D6_CRIGR|nr:hypothetical protein I79_020173 [Cricetulus griseus]